MKWMRGYGTKLVWNLARWCVVEERQGAENKKFKPWTLGYRNIHKDDCKKASYREATLEAIKITSVSHFKAVLACWCQR